MAAALAAATGLPAAAAGEDAQPAAKVQVTKLSDERKLSRWAHVGRVTDIKAFPRHKSKTVGRLRLLTEDGLPEVYLLLQARTTESGARWVQLRIPGRPNGRKGWVLRQSLGDYHRTDKSLLLERAKRRVTLFRDGKKVFTMRVGVGKPETPTPAGRFWIREKFRVADVGGLYGPRALGTAAYAPSLSDWPNGGVVGFHGTNQPQLIPGAPSHGCIRLRNEDVLRFYRAVPVGTPLRIE